MVAYPMDCTTGHTLANNTITMPARVISAFSKEEFLHMQDFRIAKSQPGMHVAALGILERALAYV